MKKAILFGASGFIGSYLLNELLNDSDYDQVTIVVRKDLNIIHPKLKTLIGNYQTLPSLKDKDGLLLLKYEKRTSPILKAFLKKLGSVASCCCVHTAADVQKTAAL